MHFYICARSNIVNVNVNKNQPQKPTLKEHNNKINKLSQKNMLVPRQQKRPSLTTNDAEWGNHGPANLQNRPETSSADQ